MKKLQKKYINDSLTEEELEELKKKVNSSTDEQLSSVFMDFWNNDDFCDANIDKATIEDIKKEIDNKTKRILIKSPKAIFRRVVSIAASILLPILILSTVYLYNQNKVMTEAHVVIETKAGERVSIILPDETKVDLNELSKMEYSPNSMNKDKRTVYFEGEGYFNVHKDLKHPFTINTYNLTVTVLGTKFNLYTRSEDENAVIALDEGKVQLISKTSDETAIITSGQMATVNNKTGKINITSREESLYDASAWKKGELVFRNTPFNEMTNKLEKTFGINIKFAEANDSDRFTGIFSSDDLNEVISIIEKTYHVKGRLNGRDIIFSKR